ncbi:hypothetical protein [Anabaena azotica]|uniref:Uncharacterized protein n=1 Tax=Anabaena azotica FACHB-119 TaxID=947527 RepID=A0ABR8DBA4_9NOST|nr:hypothetical protein [Anabaena azotica]MBD2503421.1 hypothetical protein [Anabaena azotica FACHB-119]
MPNAIITQTTLSGNINNVSFVNALRDALISVGYTSFDTFLVGSAEHRILALNSSSAAKGTVYLQISCNSSFNTGYQLHESWNTSPTARGGTNSTINVGIGGFAAGTTAVTFYSVNHPEAKLVTIEQGTSQSVVGVIRPKGIAPSWWNENDFAYAFQTKYNTNPPSSRLAGTTSPSGNNAFDYEYMQFSKMQDGNPRNNDARSIFPLCILSAGASGILESCNDLIVTASNTMRIRDTIPVSDKEIYTYIWGNALSSGIAIRTTGG